MPCFGPRIAIVSLGSPCVMIFSHLHSDARHEVMLEERSLTLLSGAARTDWRHGIPARKSDRVGRVKVARGRRLSVTVRTVRQRAGPG